MKNAISWFSIPVHELQRAVIFYNTILGTELRLSAMGGSEIAFFPIEKGCVGGHLFAVRGFDPERQGAIVYLNAGKDLQKVMNRVEPAGGRVLIHKTPIAKEIGYFGMFADSEGNRVALHSPN